jgi:uncharacterized DUF497 family protein
MGRGQSRSKFAKHQVSFEEAVTVFGDLNAITIFDTRHSVTEERFVDIGLSASGRVLLVVYAERGARTRIISCRKATPAERRQYGMNKKSLEQQSVADEMLPEYDFSGGVRGKHYRAYRRGYQVTVHKEDGTVEVRDFALPEGAIMLDPGVREYLPDSEVVNRTLRGLINLLPSAHGR